MKYEPVFWCVCAFCCLNFPVAGFAEDPIVVHYSDPSLTRMEAQIGVNAAQKERFEDIVVKYRDPFNNPDTDDSSQGIARNDRRRVSRGATQDEAVAPPRRTVGKVTRNELDELATILTPAQLQKFKALNVGTNKRRHSS